MQVEISITIPPDRSFAKFRMDGRLFSELLDIFRDALGDPKTTSSSDLMSWKKKCLRIRTSRHDWKM